MYAKYPRTMHFDWSLSLQNDDRRLETNEHFIGKRVIVSEKYDGENTTFYIDHLHARSMDSKHHPSRNWIKSFHGKVKWKIPDSWRVCVENCYATHSIEYRRRYGNALPSFCMGISIWKQDNKCMSWDETVDYFKFLDIVPVKVLYDGIYNENILKQIAKDQNPKLIEGYVCRVADGFSYEDFGTHVAKYVRARHVQSSEHWMNSEIVPNEEIE